MTINGCKPLRCLNKLAVKQVTSHLTIADDIKRSVIQEQVEMGVAVRMAAMDLLARNLRSARQAKAS